MSIKKDLLNNYYFFIIRFYLWEKHCKHKIQKQSNYKQTYCKQFGKKNQADWMDKIIGIYWNLL